MVLKSIKINDVKTNFNKMNKDGHKEVFSKLPIIADVGKNHVQGYTQYQNGDQIYYIFTHSMGNGKPGKIIISKGKKSSDTTFDLPEGCSHPGGIQALDKYVFVPCEEGSTSVVFIYDILAAFSSSSNAKKPIMQLKFDHRAGSLGITDFTYNNQVYYLLLIGANTKYHAYVSKAPEDGDMRKLDFKYCNYFELVDLNISDGKDIDCQGFGIVTDTKNNMFMIALTSRESSTTYSDDGYLITIHTPMNSNGLQNISVDKSNIVSKHFHSNGIGGKAGTHFCFGAGIRVKPEGALVVLATSRSIVRILETNFWRE